MNAYIYTRPSIYTYIAYNHAKIHAHIHTLCEILIHRYIRACTQGDMHRYASHRQLRQPCSEYQPYMHVRTCTHTQTHKRVHTYIFTNALYILDREPWEWRSASFLLTRISQSKHARALWTCWARYACVCMCVCVYIHIYIYIYIYNMQVCMYACISQSKYLMHADTGMDVVYIYVYLCIRVNMHAYTCNVIYTYTHASD